VRGGNRVSVFLDLKLHDIPETVEVGPVAGKRLLHLQCHIGLDTLSWARLGAQVTGVERGQRVADHRLSVTTDAHLPTIPVTGNLSLARTLLAAPDILLCDEPYTGLDEAGSGALTDTLAERRASGAAMVLVTHNLGEGLALATHVAIMRRGRFVKYEARRAVDDASYASAYRELVTADA